MTLSADMTPTERERDSLVAALRNTTALGRLNHTESHGIFSALADLGYSVTKNADPEPATTEPAAA